MALLSREETELFTRAVRDEYIKLTVKSLAFEQRILSSETYFGIPIQDMDTWPVQVGDVFTVRETTRYGNMVLDPGTWVRTSTNGYSRHHEFVATLPDDRMPRIGSRFTLLVTGTICGHRLTPGDWEYNGTHFIRVR